ncbi:uncharacterized protein BT62DRAFT_934411 [Guyanagaster necrorhizus]|uniref:Uncharacterized protein n=1 Tax=Guyanagaster necrorhizus TaxID=856835 RepID=A0A9P8AQU5_9AGAR|nr:uncharacterized protein BT62DRAFT_934411 [Guyanagaster necrorhizus MCA 3950]KAG7444231.1 hypothetical protein BT62DRAFT_934411 [Guyanagaster necrorhizus MCA 3950]
MSRRTSSVQDIDDYPSLLWIVVPSVVLASAYFARKWYLARKLKVHGIGKGAPGFQTGVRRVRVTPDIATRIQRGEEVSPEEIAESIARAEREAENGLSSTVTPSKMTSPPAEPVNEWLPESLSRPKKQGKRRRK